MPLCGVTLCSCRGCEPGLAPARPAEGSSHPVCDQEHQAQFAGRRACEDAPAVAVVTGCHARVHVCELRRVVAGAAGRGAVAARAFPQRVWRAKHVGDVGGDRGNVAGHAVGEDPGLHTKCNAAKLSRAPAARHRQRSGGGGGRRSIQWQPSIYTAAAGASAVLCDCKKHPGSASCCTCWCSCCWGL